MRTIFLFPLVSLGIGLGQTLNVSSTRDATPSANHDRARGFLDDALKDKNPDTRMHAVQALSLVSPQEPYLTQLEAMLDDKDVPVRLAAIASLVDLKNTRTVPALRKALDSDVPEVSFAAAKALWTLDEPDGREALFRAAIPLHQFHTRSAEVICLIGRDIPLTV